jgi:hypothetical protein
MPYDCTYHERLVSFIPETHPACHTGLMLWLSRRPEWQRSREFETTTSSSTPGYYGYRESDNAFGEEEEDDSESLTGKRRTRVVFQPTTGTSHTIFYRGHWLRVQRSRKNNGYELLTIRCVRSRPFHHSAADVAGGGAWPLWEQYTSLPWGDARAAALVGPSPHARHDRPGCRSYDERQLIRPPRGSSFPRSVVARNNSILKQLVLQAKKEYEAEAVHRIQIYFADSYGSWRWTDSRHKRPMSSIVLNPGVKEMLVSDTKDFLKSEKVRP